MGVVFTLRLASSVTHAWGPCPHMQSRKFEFGLARLWQAQVLAWESGRGDLCLTEPGLGLSFLCPPSGSFRQAPVTAGCRSPRQLCFRQGFLCTDTKLPAVTPACLPASLRTFPGDAILAPSPGFLGFPLMPGPGGTCRPLCQLLPSWPYAWLWGALAS